MRRSTASSTRTGWCGSRRRRATRARHRARRSTSSTRARASRWSSLSPSRRSRRSRRSRSRHRSSTRTARRSASLRPTSAWSGWTRSSSRRPGLGGSGQMYLVGPGPPLHRPAPRDGLLRGRGALPRDRRGPAAADGARAVRRLPRQRGDRLLPVAAGHRHGTRRRDERAQLRSLRPAGSGSRSAASVCSWSGLLGIGTYLLSRRIAKPILAITETAIAVTHGDLTREAPVTTNDEVGTLARRSTR